MTSTTPRHMIARAALRATLAGPLVGLASCAAVPNVDYHVMGAGQAHDDWVAFRLSDSVIVVGTPPKSAKDDADISHGDGYGPPLSLDAETVDYSACDQDSGICIAPELRTAAVPTSDMTRVLAIVPRLRAMVSTTVAPGYYPNSLRLKTLTIEAKDHRLEAINTFAAIAAGVKNFIPTLTGTSTQSAGEAIAPLHLPLTIDLAAARAANAVIDPAAPAGGPAPAPAALPGNRAGWTYTITFLDSPPSNGFAPASAVTGVHRAMVGSLCRPARLTLLPVHYTKVPITLDITLADPAWLVTAPFPAKGALVFAPLCGIDVQPQPVTEVGTDAMATAFFNSVNSIRTPQH
jgi:hypothetical protein